MFLLKPGSGLTGVLFANGFTFHNVSIKTKILSSDVNKAAVFTFHNVSIKTKCEGTGGFFTRIYIPQCFY